MDQILFVDDDAAILRIVQRHFEARGFGVHTATTSKEASSLLHCQPIDCVILDIMLPGTDGFHLCQSFKSITRAPIIFLTCLTEREFLYQGFISGGDDFMTKPFDLRELEMRIRARISQSRSTSLQAMQLRFPPLTLDVGSRVALCHEKTLPLTAYEFDILLLLAQNPDRFFSQEEIYRTIWNLPDLTNALTVKVHVARLRHKLEDAIPGNSFITTAWKRGYKFCPNSENPSA